MSSYNNYPHDPPPAQFSQSHHPAAQPSDPLSQNNLPVRPPYQYNPQPPPQPIYHSADANGHVGHIQPLPPANGGTAPKVARLRKACDNCSERKVKCDETGPPCKACAALTLECTFNRPSRRRGPPNRHAEAIKEREKRRRLGEAQSSPAVGGSSTPASPNNVAATLVAFSSTPKLSAEAICSFDVLKLLIDDFFTYIHPLTPFPHEPTFRGAFKHREDLTNPYFLALLASMVGLLVASFPRRPRLHLRNQQHHQNLFPTSMSMVERCHKIAVEARGTGYLDKELSVYDAVTSYFLGLAAAYTYQWKVCRLYFGETLTILRVHGAHKIDPDPQDYIRQQIGRRLFWIMFVGVRSMQQLGATYGELLIPPPTPSEPYPPLPLEVDDEFIFEKRVDPQPDGLTSKLVGFNLNVRIYESLNQLAAMELAYGIDHVFDWNRQKRLLEHALRFVKGALESAPRELILIPNPHSGHYEPVGLQQYPPVTNYPGNQSNGSIMPEWDLETRRNVQFEIQKANIYASQLGTRSYIVEKYWNLHEVYESKANNGGAANLSSPGVMATGLDAMLPVSPTSNYAGIETIVANERESIVRDLLRVLGSISQVNMEPNAASFINKIRQIASTLIGTPQDRKGPLALQSEEYLERFMDVLMKLERISPGLHSPNADGSVDEEEELRNWADLREHQMRFAQSGGFLVS